MLGKHHALTALVSVATEIEVDKNFGAVSQSDQHHPNLDDK